jgi:hypothetical protein
VGGPRQLFWTLSRHSSVNRSSRPWFTSWIPRPLSGDVSAATQRVQGNDQLAPPPPRASSGLTYLVCRSRHYQTTPPTKNSHPATSSGFAQDGPELRASWSWNSRTRRVCRRRSNERREQRQRKRKLPWLIGPPLPPTQQSHSRISQALVLSPHAPRPGLSPSNLTWQPRAPPAHRLTSHASVSVSIYTSTPTLAELNSGTFAHNRIRCRGEAF